ncbi:MAG: hypothetical protein ACSHWU_01150 [Marinicella sp.]
MMKRKKITIAVSMALGLVQLTAHAQFKAELNLADLNGDNGFVINGVAEDDRSGYSVSSAGDVNGDGIDDVIIGAYRAGSDGNNLAGSSYVVFGSDSGLPNPLNLEDINGINGFVINGVAAADFSGVSVSAAGDVNGDGIDDVIIGAWGSDPGGNNVAGSSYVVFGSDSGLPNPLKLDQLNGVNGFVVNGVGADNRSGSSVSAAGDVNGDGIDDVIIGAWNGSNIAAGSSYVVFGSDSGLPNPLNLVDINGDNGFVINGVATHDQSGISVSAAGDVNDDGIDDVIIGANFADPGGNNSAGSSYVVFGSDSPLPNPFNLDDINGLNGFVINGVAAGDRSGESVSAAGDVNGDGVDDVIIGARLSDPDGNSDAGSSYVVFGSDSRLPNPFNLEDINGENGFVVNGVAANDQSGISVSVAGDVNGDGIDDVIIGAEGADPGGNSVAGSSYVVFGSDSGLPNPLNLDDINGNNGFVINGVVEFDTSGSAVSAAGDVNGDGIDDVIIGADRADPGGNSEAGSSYVVFGSDVIFEDGFE